MLFIFSWSRSTSRWIYTSGKTLTRFLPIILWKSVLRCSKVEFTFFLSGFSFTNIHNSQDNRGGYLFLTCLMCLFSVICIFNCLVSYVFSTAKRWFTGHLRIALVFVILTITPLLSESLLGKTHVTMVKLTFGNPQKASGHLFIKN